MEKNFRRLTIDDYEDILRVWNVAGLPIKSNGRESRNMLAAEISRDHCAAFGLFVDSQMVGVVIANYDGRRGWVNRLAVDPDYRGIGLAKELIEKSEEFLGQFGEVILCALIEEPNYPSMALFEKAGYVCMSEVKYWSKRPRPDL